MQNYKIPDSSITASSYYRDRTAARRGRLHLADRYTPPTLYTGGWCRGQSRYTWLMVDFSQDMYVTQVATQGKQELDFWVKTYYLLYRKNGGNWQWFYKDRKVSLFWKSTQTQNKEIMQLKSVNFFQWTVRRKPRIQHQHTCEIWKLSLCCA
jgi:hypothetical protein